MKRSTFSSKLTLVRKLRGILPSREVRSVTSREDIGRGLPSMSVGDGVMVHTCMPGLCPFFVALLIIALVSLGSILIDDRTSRALRGSALQLE